MRVGGGSARLQPATGSDSTSRSIPFGSRSQLGKWMFSFLFHSSSSLAFPLPPLLLLASRPTFIYLYSLFCFLKTVTASFNRMTYYLKLKSNYIMSTTALLHPNPSAISQLSDSATEWKADQERDLAGPINLTEWFNDKKTIEASSSANEDVRWELNGRRDRTHSPFSCNSCRFIYLPFFGE